MELKQRLQQDLRDAIRARDEPRLNVIRMVLAAFENAQEAMGKQAFNPDGANIPPDRHQILSEQAIRDIVRREVQQRREAADLFRAGGQNTRAEHEEAEITILEGYLAAL